MTHKLMVLPAKDSQAIRLIRIPEDFEEHEAYRRVTSLIASVEETNPNCDWERWESIDQAGVRDYIELKIADNGCGISKENLSRIFEPFYTTKGQKGTGLGLAVIWGIIDNHDGTINVESELNKGTTFTILLPINQQGS
jgi:signal transduction histidine kinase